MAALDVSPLLPPHPSEAGRHSRTCAFSQALREQVRQAVVHFVQGLLDAPENRELRRTRRDMDGLARQLWDEGLVIAYRLLFLLKLESSSDAAQRFPFTRTQTWRKRFSPDTALARLVANDPCSGTHAEHTLSKRLKALFRLFCDGAVLDDARVVALGGRLFGAAGTPLLDAMHWSDNAVAELLRALLWTDGKRGREDRAERIHYGRLEVEDLGRIYEWLLEFEPGIAQVPMCRLRRGKLEVVVPLARGELYRNRNTHERLEPLAGNAKTRRASSALKPARVRATVATKLSFVEEIPKHHFYLRAGLGRKSSGSYYTPQAFVRFLVRETLEPQIARLSPAGAPNPEAILSLRILDPAMGTGHFLVQACRFLGQALFDALSACSLPGRPNRTRTLAECRTLVAKHCLYGIDKNPLAVELARASLWLESDGEYPFSFTENHLVAGDSVTGPTLKHLFTFPSSGKPLEHHEAGAQLRQQLEQCLEGVHKESNAEIRDRLKLLAASWSGAVMLGDRGDDHVYEQLVTSIANGARFGELLGNSSQLSRMIAAGREGVVYELEFPEVFASKQTGGGGFDAVLGNPPWDAIKFNTKEFLASFDLRVLEAPTKKERDRIEAELTQSARIAALFEAYQHGFERLKRSNDRLYSHQKLTIDGDLAGRQLDLYRVVLERSCAVLHPTGYLGFVVPSSFHTAAGAAGVRKLVTEQHRLLKYLSFVNTRKAFDISAGAEFGLLVAAGVETPKATTLARFGIEDPDLLSSSDQLHLLEFPVESLCKGNPYLSFPTARDSIELSALASCRGGGRTFEQLASASSIDIRSTPTSVHMTHEAKHFIERRGRSRSTSDNVLLHEGATFNRFTDHWDTEPRFGIQRRRVLANPRWGVLVGHYKLALRAIVGNSKDKSIAVLLPPGCLVANSALVEGSPDERANANALALLGLLNSTVFSWLLSFYADLNVNLFALKYLPVPDQELPPFLTHHALRLSCNHTGYAPLWREQLGEHWRECAPARSWPVLTTPEQRTAARASIDAAVAHLYGLDRAQYAYILGISKHSDPTYPEQSLSAFDEINALGLQQFAKRRDPYWDVPVVTARPSAVTNLDVTATN